MMPRYDFTIDGVKASSVGLVIDRPDPPPMAAQRYNTFSVGSDADMVIPDTAYDNILYPLKARIIKKPDDFDNASLYSFLHGGRTLKLSNLPQYFFRIMKISGITPVQRVKGNEVTYSITFELAPFKYIAEEPAITVSSSGTLVQNAGTRFCMPQYKLTLSASSGAGWFEVDGQRVTITIPTDIGSTEFTVDAERQIAYDGNNQIRTMLTAGIFPYMNIGNSYVAFGGIVQSIEITRNERCY